MIHQGFVADHHHPVAAECGVDAEDRRRDRNEARPAWDDRAYAHVEGRVIDPRDVAVTHQRSANPIQTSTYRLCMSKAKPDGGKSFAALRPGYQPGIGYEPGSSMWEGKSLLLQPTHQ